MSRSCYSKLTHGLVESRTRAVAYRTGGACCERRLSWPLSPRSPSPRLASPLIEPDVTISVIRLSEGFTGGIRRGEPRKSVQSQNAQFPEYRRHGELPIPRPGQLVPSSEKAAHRMIQMQLHIVARLR